jgi:hypothetical protein
MNSICSLLLNRTLILLVFLVYFTAGWPVHGHPVSERFGECNLEKDLREQEIERRLLYREQRLWRIYDVTTQRIYRSYDNELRNAAIWYGLMAGSAEAALEVALVGCAASANPACAGIARAAFAVTITTLTIRYMLLIDEADYRKNIGLKDANEDLQDGLEAASTQYARELKISSSQWKACIEGAINHTHR